jgi:hypothetical protein
MDTAGRISSGTLIVISERRTRRILNSEAAGHPPGGAPEDGTDGPEVVKGLVRAAAEHSLRGNAGKALSTASQPPSVVAATTCHPVPVHLRK